MCKKTTTLLWSFVVLLSGYFSPATLTAQPLTVHAPIAWGSVAFTPQGQLLFPVAVIEQLSEEEIRQEREKRKAWLNRPIDEQVDELVSPHPGESEKIYEFRRWIAKRYIEWAKTNPEAVLKGSFKRVRAIEIKQLDPETGRTISRYKLWQGNIPVSNQISYLGGLGSGKKQVIPRSNIKSGILPGKKWFAAWAWVDEPHSPPITILIDPNRASEAPVSILPGYKPLSWLSDRQMLAIKYPDIDQKGHGGDKRLVLVKITLDQAGQPISTDIIVSRKKYFSAAIVPGKPNPVLVYLSWVLGVLNLQTGTIKPLRLHGKKMNMPACGQVTVWQGHIWIPEKPLGQRLLALDVQEGKFRIAKQISLPYQFREGPWCGALAAFKDGLILGRDLLIRRSLNKHASSAHRSGKVALYIYRPGGGLQKLELPPVLQPGTTGIRPIAISPDNRWLAARTGVNTLTIFKRQEILP